MESPGWAMRRSQSHSVARLSWDSREAVDVAYNGDTPHTPANWRRNFSEPVTATRGMLGLNRTILAAAANSLTGATMALALRRVASWHAAKLMGSSCGQP